MPCGCVLYLRPPAYTRCLLQPPHGQVVLALRKLRLMERQRLLRQEIEKEQEEIMQACAGGVANCQQAGVPHPRLKLPTARTQMPERRYKNLLRSHRTVKIDNARKASHVVVASDVGGAPAWPILAVNPCSQDIAARADKGAGWVRDIKAYRGEALAERGSSVRDLRVARNRGVWACALQRNRLDCEGRACLIVAQQPCAGVLRAHERLLRERNKQRDDDRTLRMEALKVRRAQLAVMGGAGGTPGPHVTCAPCPCFRRTISRRTRRCCGSRQALASRAPAASATKRSAGSLQVCTRHCLWRVQVCIARGTLSNLGHPHTFADTEEYLHRLASKIASVRMAAEASTAAQKAIEEARAKVRPAGAARCTCHLPPCTNAPPLHCPGAERRGGAGSCQGCRTGSGPERGHAGGGCWRNGRAESVLCFGTQVRCLLPLALACHGVQSLTSRHAWHPGPCSNREEVVDQPKLLRPPGDARLRDYQIVGLQVSACATCAGLAWEMHSWACEAPCIPLSRSLLHLLPVDGEPVQQPPERHPRR